MKKKISFILYFIFILTLMTQCTVFAQNNLQDSSQSSFTYTPLAPEGYNESAIAELLHGDGNDDIMSVYSSIIVKVTSPCDQRWRAKYPNSWMYEANRAIEDADEIYRKYYNIDLRSVSQKAWNSTVSIGNGLPLLDEAWSKFGLGGADIMIAFSGAMPGYGGWAYQNTSRCIIFNQGYPANASATRHEIGHLYGCDDHYNNPSFPYKCFMNDSYNQYNNICIGCDPRISKNAHRFGS